MEELKKEEGQHTHNEGDKKDSDRTLMAIVAYILFFVPLLTDSKNDPFVKYHIKQGLALFIAAVVVAIFGVVPVIGWILAPLLSLVLFILWVIGIINAVQGKEKRLPIIGKFGEGLKI